MQQQSVPHEEKAAEARRSVSSAGTEVPQVPWAEAHTFADTPTPGQMAYAAFTAAHDPSLFWSTEGWDHLQRMTQQAWEAAAQAVRATQKEEDCR